MDIDLLAADNVVLRRLNEGEEAAFDYFFHRYFPLMQAFARRFIADEGLAEEVVLDVFFKVWEKRSDFADAKTLKAFLYIATKNASFNALKKDQSRHKHQASSILGHEQTEASVIREIVRSEVYATLSLAINTLPEQCRRIIQLIFEEDKKPSEIAEALGITISTVNSQKARGLALLRDKLKGEDLDTLLIFIVLGVFRH